MSLAAPALAAARSRGAPLSYGLAPHALALAMFALCAASPSIFNDGDTFSHIAAGDWILAHRAIPHTDPFTYSMAGQAWTAHEWLSEVALALAYRAAGFVGVALLTGAAAGAATYIVLKTAARDLGGPALAAVGVLALLLIAPGLLARPHILALPLFAIWATMLHRARDRAPPLAAAALMTIWANLHGGFAFGLALIAPFAADAVASAAVERRVEMARGWALFAAVAGVAALINPFGFEGLWFPVRLLGLKSLAQVGEWAPENFARLNGLELVLLGVIGVALSRPVRLPPIRRGLLLALLYLSLTHARHELLLAIVGPLLMAKPVAESFAAPAETIGGRGRAAGWVAAAAVLAVVRLALPAPVIHEWNSTREALAALPPDIASRPVLNGYGFGGYLIFAGVRPYVDGRADMFGDAFLGDYAKIARGERAALAAALARHNVGWTMFAPDQGAVATLDSTPGWRRIYADGRVVVHARTSP